MKCPNCGRDVQGGICASCGHSVREARGPVVELILLFLVGTPALAMGGCGVYALVQDQTTEPGDYSGIGTVIGGFTGFVGLSVFAIVSVAFLRARKKRIKEKQEP